MKVKKGKYFEDDSFSGRYRCGDCDSLVEVSEKDIIVGYRYLSVGSWSDYKIYLVICPVCNEKISLSIPGIVERRILEHGDIMLMLDYNSCKEDCYIEVCSLRKTGCIYRSHCEKCHDQAFFSYCNLPRPVKNRLNKFSSSSSSSQSCCVIL